MSEVSESIKLTIESVLEALKDDYLLTEPLTFKMVFECGSEVTFSIISKNT